MTPTFLNTITSYHFEGKSLEKNLPVTLVDSVASSFGSEQIT